MFCTSPWHNVHVSAPPVGVPSHSAFTCRMCGNRTKPGNAWIRIHALPGFVRFPHMRHVKALCEGTPTGGALTCTLCHGDVQNMAQVYQVETLKMGWCIR